MRDEVPARLLEVGYLGSKLLLELIELLVERGDTLLSGIVLLLGLLKPAEDESGSGTLNGKERQSRRMQCEM